VQESKQGEEQREREIISGDSVLCAEPDAGLDSRTLRS